MALRRIVYKDIITDITRREIGIITGPRQVGKTTILKGVRKYCMQYGINHKYFNLEMPQDAIFFARGFGDVLSDIGKGRQVVLIDEFHYLPNATKLFKSIYDGCKQVKIFASGSSAIEMHKHLKESLAGRRRIYQIFPLSFEEWVPSKSTKIKLPQKLTPVANSGNHRLLKKYMEEYIIFGGMPGLVHERNLEDKKRLLLDLVATYIQKDIKALLREEDILSFNRFLTLLAGREGGLLSENNVSQNLNYSLRQVRKDVAILSQMFLLNVLKPFFSNRGRELRQMSKIYFFDSGIRNAILRDFRSLSQRLDKGVLVESFVLHEFSKRLKVSQEIYYWRTREKEEVDFVLIQDRKPLPVEVKTKMNTTEVPEGIKSFLRKYPECDTAIVLNEDIFSELSFRGKKVFFMPHYFAHLVPRSFF